MTCRLIATGTVTGNCSTWQYGEVDLGDITAASAIPAQSVRNNPSTGCPTGTPLSKKGVQMNRIVGYANTSYENVTWQTVPTLIKRGTSCTPAPINYDCINGACIPKTTYNTPGIYATLSDCEVACGTGCSGKCISNADWAAIEGRSSQLKSINCS